jgi:hypothetical protein
MVKILLAVSLAVLIVLAVGFFSAQETDPNATECEKDCINDSGGKAWCSEYCKKNGTYGPAKK